MHPVTTSRFAAFLGGAAVAGLAFVFGASHSAPLQAQPDKPAAQQHDDNEPLGVSIPSGGAALVKGKDGFAYIVDTRGVFVRASQSGKGLELP